MVDSLIDRIAQVLAILAGILLCAMAALLCVDVAVRYLQVINIAWIGDVAAVSLYLVTFLAAPWVLREGGHIAIDSVVQGLSARLRRAVQRLVNLAGALISAVICFYAIRVLIASYAAGTQVFKMLIYPQWWLFTVPPVTFGLMTLIFLMNTRAKV